MMPVDQKQLVKLYNKHQLDLRKYNENRRYVEGDNPYILDLDPSKKPDNRIPVPLAKMAVEDLTGYAARPGSIKVNIRPMDAQDEVEDDAYIQAVNAVSEYNNDDLENTELYEEGLTHGVAYELHYVSTALDSQGLTLTPEYKIVDGSEITVVWTKSLKPSLEYAVRWVREEDDTEAAEVFYPLMWERWERPKGGGNWRKVSDDGESYRYPYRRVPVAVFAINRKMHPVFSAEKALINAHDKLISSSQNEIDRFNALIALFPGQIDKQFVDKLHEMKVIDNLSQYEHWPEYLEKSLQNIDSFYNTLADRYERLFHKSIKVPDFTDESFAGDNASGVSIAYKLVGLEFKATLIDSYFDQGLDMRFDLINDVLAFPNLADSVDYSGRYTYDIQHKRNLPVDKTNAVDLAIKLMGIVSKETILRILPDDIVPDVKAELERLEASKPDEEEIVTDEEDDV